MVNVTFELNCPQHVQNTTLICRITADNIMKTDGCQINHSTEEFKLRLPMTKKLDLKILKSRIPSGYCDIDLKIAHLIIKLLMLWSTL